MPWSTLVDKAREQGLPQSAVVTEGLHIIVLEALFATPESQEICLQGGTSIHLLYGGYRYSEDLDIAGKNLYPTLAQKIIAKAQSHIEKNAIQMLGNGQYKWRIPYPSSGKRIYVVWFDFQPEGRQQKINTKIEFARYPIYQPKIMPVRSEVDVLQKHPLITGLSTVELLAEKITAVAGRPYIKGRDLFDLWYLSDVLGTAVELNMVKNKFRDYKIDFTMDSVKQKLTNYSSKALTAEMERFLPQSNRRQIQNNNYEAIRYTAFKIMQTVIKDIPSARERP